MKRLIIIAFSIVIFFLILIYFGNDFLRMFESNHPSMSLGTVNKGQLKYGKRLPTKGNNFITYSRFGSLLGRNSVNQKVRDAIVDSYDKIYNDKPELTFVIGETSWPGGGKFWPHKSHQNGLSVDFFVPVKNERGQRIPIPTNIFNKFGYGIEFDSLGKYKDLKIDFEAMGYHLLQLKKSAEKFGLKIEVVIFDNALQKLLFNTQYGEELKSSIRFSKLKPWIRHDEHYHVDFTIVHSS